MFHMQLALKPKKDFSFSLLKIKNFQVYQFHNQLNLILFYIISNIYHLKHLVKKFLNYCSELFFPVKFFTNLEKNDLSPAFFCL